MARIRFLSFLLLFAKLFLAQTNVYRDTIPVFESNTRLLMPWAGGINFSSFTQIDLNSDGKKDIVAYDKICGSGGKLRAYLNVGSAGLAKYKHAFHYQDQFPSVNEWALFFDYNNDGKEDLFTYTPGGIKVYKNNSVGQNLSFSLASPLLRSDYNPAGTPNVSNLYCNSVALPGISDIDNDGDLDILSFSVFGIKIEYHKNMSQELYGTSDSLVFDMVDDCWGDIKENNCQVDLNQCPFMKMYNNSIQDTSNKVLHSGSCIMCFDRDGDGDKELIMGDISCSNVFFVDNQGDISNAHIGDTTILYPNYPAKGSTDIIKMNSFPCTYNLDVDNDGFKDLIASPNAVAGSENYQSVWYYKNASSTPTVNFVFQKKNFLQEDMIELGEGAYPVLFDADNDGKKDLIVGHLGYYTGNTNKSRLAYYRNIGSTTAPSFSLITKDYQSLSSYNIFSMAPTFGDLDNDGDQDLIIGDNNGQLHYFQNIAISGAPALFANHMSNYQSIDVGNFAYPQLYDLNKNGTLDLVIGAINGKLSYYSNIGTAASPSFSLQTTFLGGVDVRQTSIGSITGYSMPFLYNNAGVTKLLVGSEIGNIYSYDNIDGNLSGTFNRVDTTLFNINEGPRCAVFYEDITNDGKRDLLIGNQAGGLAFFNSTNVNGVGIEELLSENDVQVFPNPTSDKITIAFKNSHYEELEIKCLDILGHNLFETTTLSKLIQVDMSSFDKGVYFILITNPNNNHSNTITKKVIVLD
ncbi:MAG: hypothetical protein C0448_05985 [Sphingobacteriaceae bacterium]|nr:hypothetical protein [Sphingobacteriaceae bacterium]